MEPRADPDFRTVEQPLKIPFIAAIVLLANVQKPEFTSEILQKVGNTLQRRLETGSWREVKLYLRFLGCLQGLFEDEGVFVILEELFSRAVDLQTQSSEDVSFVTLPHCHKLIQTAVSRSGISQGHPRHYPLHHGVVCDRFRIASLCAS